MTQLLDAPSLSQWIGDSKRRYFDNYTGMARVSCVTSDLHSSDCASPMGNSTAMAATACIAVTHGSFNRIRQVCSYVRHLIHGSQGPYESTPQTASRSVQLFLHNSPLHATSAAIACI